MIIKGKSRSGASALSLHLSNMEKNEHVALVEIRGTVSQNLRGALIEMDALAAGTKCVKSLYHAAISPQPPYRLSQAQRLEAVDALEAKLGLHGHARVVVVHEKLGREHLHVVWTRIDLKRMVSVHDGHNYRKHEEVARDLERRFGHEHVQGAHHGREGVKRPERTPSRAELRQEERTGLLGRLIRAEVTNAFRASDSAEAFKRALHDRGMILALGDRRDFVVIDRAGGIHSLARRLEGVRAADLTVFMAPIDRTILPTADQAVAIVRERIQAASGNDTELAKLRAYGRGDDYVSQATAAQQDFETRRQRLDQATRLNRLRLRVEREVQTDHRHDAGPNPRPPAPGGGRTRSR